MVVRICRWWVFLVWIYFYRQNIEIKETGSKVQPLVSKTVCNILIKKLAGIINQFINRLLTWMPLLKVLRVRLSTKAARNQPSYMIVYVYTHLLNKINAFCNYYTRVKILHKGRDPSCLHSNYFLLSLCRSISYNSLDPHNFHANNKWWFILVCSEV